MRYIVLLLLVSILTPVLAAAPIEIPRSRSERPKLKSIYGVPHQMQELVAEGKSGVVFIFTDVDCPVAQALPPSTQSVA